MSTLGGSYSQYGTYQKGYDYNMFYTKSRATVVYSGSGVLTAGTYLKRPFDNYSQGLYIPPGTVGSFVVRGFINLADGQSYAAVSTDGEFENVGGTVTITGGAATFDTNATVTVTANSTIDGIEVVVDDTDDPGTAYEAYIEIDFYFQNFTYDPGKPYNLYVASGASALAADETPNA
jgi:hypothetical protein